MYLLSSALSLAFGIHSLTTYEKNSQLPLWNLFSGGEAFLVLDCLENVFLNAQWDSWILKFCLVNSLVFCHLQKTLHPQWSAGSVSLSAWPLYRGDSKSWGDFWAHTSADPGTREAGAHCWFGGQRSASGRHPILSLLSVAKLITPQLLISKTPYDVEINLPLYQINADASRRNCNSKERMRKMYSNLSTSSSYICLVNLGGPF